MGDTEKEFSMNQAALVTILLHIREIGALTAQRHRLRALRPQAE